MRRAKTVIFSLIIVITSFSASAQKTSLLKLSNNQRYIVAQDDKPFFWLGGTAWELIHRLNREEVDKYLTDRARKGFTVIQTVILAEMDGLNTPNAYGQKPLIDNDPTKINELYFKHVDYVIKEANELGLYIGLLPTWGDKFNDVWGIGPIIFNPVNAEIYGEILAKRYLSNNNIIWILGGDRIPQNDKQYAIIRAMAKGIRKIDKIHLITYHPQGGENAAKYFNDNWLDVDMFQSGHSRLAKEYEYVLNSRKLKPTRPVIAGETRYENIQDRFWEEKNYGWLDDADVRVSAYWSMISGAAGYTYGCNDIWQMYDITREPTLKARTGWTTALDLPGSTQMKYMKKIFETFPWQEMNYDQSLILNDNPENESYMVSAVGKDKDFMMAYTPLGKPVNIDLSKMKSEKVDVFWFNPRSGKVKEIGVFKTAAPHEFRPWSDGWGSDFLLIIVAEDSPYKILLMNK